MSNFPNNQNDETSQQNSKLNWEVIRSYEYEQNMLLKTSLLYVFKICKQGDHDYTSNSIDRTNLNDTVLLRMSILKENISNNKLTELEILTGIFPYKFDHKDGDYILLLQFVSQYFADNIGIKLPKEVENSFIEEYKEAIQMLDN